MEGVDRINELRDEMLVNNIMSRLDCTTNALIRTTATISKRWKNLWTQLPHLIFSYFGYDDTHLRNYISFIDNTLNQCPANLNLRRFKLHINYINFPFEETNKNFNYNCVVNSEFKSRANTWIRYAISRNVEDVDLWLPDVGVGQDFTFEDELFFKTSCISRMALSYCRFDPPNGAISWEILECLCLYYATLDEDMIEKILSGSPCLESLELKDCHGYRRIDVTSRSVKKLVFSDYYYIEEDCIDCIKINAPYISSLSIYGYFELDLVLLDVSSLTKAELDYSIVPGMPDDITPEEILRGLLESLDHVKDVIINDFCWEGALITSQINNILGLELDFLSDMFPDRVHVMVIDTSSSLENRGKLADELKKADAVVLTYACDQPSTLDRLSTFWLPELRRLEVNFLVIVAGCKFNLKDEHQAVSLEQVMSSIMQEFREIETCIECSAYKHIQIPEVFHNSQKDVLHPTAPLFGQEIQTLKPRCVRALKRIFIGRPFSEIYTPTTEERYTVNMVDQPGGTKKTLILREIPEDAIEKLLVKKEALGACDMAVFVHDGSKEASWIRAIELLVQVASHGESNGYEVPCLIVAAKDDLEPYPNAIEALTGVSQDMGIQAPIPISTKLGDFNNVFKRTEAAAEHPHLSIPETEAGKTRKWYHSIRSARFL